MKMIAIFIVESNYHGLKWFYKIGIVKNDKKILIKGF